MFLLVEPSAVERRSVKEPRRFPQ